MWLKYSNGGLWMARVLIVDDSSIMQRNLLKVLTEGGHEVVGQAISGIQAVSLYTELNPDIVTMDISMPIMNGVEAVKYIINKDINANIIMISALNQKSMVFDALNNGAKNYIIKPIDPERLLKTISEILIEADKRNSENNELNIDRDRGFMVQNINGSFEFVFNEKIDLKDITLIQTAIDGLLFINPLKVVFNFQETGQIKDGVLLPIIGMSKRIRDSAGDIQYKSQDEELINKINKLEKN
jgi:YesN/AraC family two-component response regulator